MTTIESATGVEVVVAGRRLVSFAGCDYLGLSRHPEVVAAAHAALDRCGVGAGASRTTTGTWLPHLELERALARWMQAEDAVVLPSGYLAATALAVALAPMCDVVLLDQGAHPAVRDAARASGLTVREFPHFDADAAAGLAKGARALVLTDAVDVAAGTVAPLRALRSLVAGARGALIVDDAHGVGVLGAKGRGTANALSATGPRVHAAGSLSKALGAHGGFVTGTKALCNSVRDRFGGYAGGTPVPPSIAAAAATAVRLAASGDRLRRRLTSNAVRLSGHLAALGAPVPSRAVPWFAAPAGEIGELSRISIALAERGFLVPHLTYFGAPQGGYLKLALTAAHRASHIDAVASALCEVMRPASGRITSPRASRR